MDYLRIMRVMGWHQLRYCSAYFNEGSIPYFFITFSYWEW